MLCLAPINRTSIKKYLYIHGLPRTSPQLPLQSDLLLPIPQPCSNQSQIPELSHFFVIGLLASLSCKDCNQLLGFCNWLTCYKWIFTYDSLEYTHILYIYTSETVHLKPHTQHMFVVYVDQFQNGSSRRNVAAASISAASPDQVYQCESRRPDHVPVDGQASGPFAKHRELSTERVRAVRRRNIW
jgi:hypothetical protein